MFQSAFRARQGGTYSSLQLRANCIAAIPDTKSNYYLYNNSEDAQFFHEFTGTINHSWMTNQSARIDLIILQMQINLRSMLHIGSQIMSFSVYIRVSWFIRLISGQMFDINTHTFTSLECKEHVKYLVILLDGNPSWKFHIEHGCIKSM